MNDQLHPSEPRARDVTSRGARLRFSVTGDGLPLVLIHDFLSSGLAWTKVGRLLAKTVRVVTPDLPGMGESEKPPPDKYEYTAESFAESIMDLTAAVGIERFAICGHGLGGGIALVAAANHPSRVSRLIVVNPVVYSSGLDPFWRLAALPVLGPIAFKQLLGRGLFRYHLSRTVGAFDGVPGGPKEQDELFTQFNSPAAREAAYATMTAMLDPRTISAAVPRITSPTLVVWGRSRKAHPLEHGRRLTRELAQARLHVIDCEGSPAYSAPEAFATEVSQFVCARRAP